ncbi:MAG TPA: glycosyltransferase family 1 protein [Gammaproteobacteria bacterium]|nr:glycosyltransferase family 1 protein [Gammaproteobacteria bacterium]
MHIVDTTMFYAPVSGGVKRYLLAKHQWLEPCRALRHTLLVPGRTDRHDGAGLECLASAPLPFGHGYRLPLNLPRWRAHLEALAPDLIEAGDPYQLAWVALRAGRNRGVPVVGFYHSDLVRLLGVRLGNWVEPAVGEYVRRLYERFDLVLAPSRMIADKLESLGLHHVRHQPLGVDTELFNPRRRDPGLRRELGLHPDTRLLVFAGRFAREKNIPLLAAAVRRLGPRYQLLLVGGGGPLPPLPPNVSVLPYQAAGRDVARLVASCDLLVHAGGRETFGLVVLEAMACGLPVVGVDSGAVAELVDEDVGQIARSGDLDSLVEAIGAVFERGADMLGRAALERVRRRYTWGQVLRRQIAAYAELAGVRSPLEEEPELEAHAAG